jgi:hypothetical protein
MKQLMNLLQTRMSLNPRGNECTLVMSKLGRNLARNSSEIVVFILISESALQFGRQDVWTYGFMIFTK